MNTSRPNLDNCLLIHSTVHVLASFGSSKTSLCCVLGFVLGCPLLLAVIIFSCLVFPSLVWSMCFHSCFRLCYSVLTLCFHQVCLSLIQIVVFRGCIDFPNSVCGFFTGF